MMASRSEVTAAVFGRAIAATVAVSSHGSNLQKPIKLSHGGCVDEAAGRDSGLELASWC
jgi:hypothetical protein